MLSFGWLEIHAVDHCNNNCRWCHNYSPFSKKMEYEAKEYFEGLDVLKRNSVFYHIISIMGGEPFLHTNLLKFSFEILERYRKPLMLTSNGFWLSESAIDDYKDLWKIISTLKISRYPTIEKRLGGPDQLKYYIELLKNKHPHLNIDFPDKGYFNRLEFYDEPFEVEMYCGNSQCTALLTDMRLGRCGAGAYTHLAPHGLISENFRNSKHMMYDLKKFDPASFWLWRNRYPLDACSYCSFSKKTKFTTWKIERGKGLFNKEYEVDYYYLLGKNIILKHDYSKVNNTIQTIKQLNGDCCQSQSLEGLKAFFQGNLDVSLQHFINALKFNPSSKEVFYYIGKIKYLSKQKS